MKNPVHNAVQLDRSRERSRRFVDAAHDLLDAEGLEGLTIRAVLKKTKLSRRAFYQGFADKDDLVLAAFGAAIRVAAERLSTQISAFPDPLERLRVLVTCLVLGTSLTGRDSERSRRRGAAMSREHLRLAQTRPDALQSALQPLVGLIAQQLAAAIAGGSVKPGDPLRLATFVYNLVSTTVHTEFLMQTTANADRTRRARLAADLWEFCRCAMVAERAVQ